MLPQAHSAARRGIQPALVPEDQEQSNGGRQPCWPEGHRAATDSQKHAFTRSHCSSIWVSCGTWALQKPHGLGTALIGKMESDQQHHHKTTVLVPAVSAHIIYQLPTEILPTKLPKPQLSKKQASATRHWAEMTRQGNATAERQS